jgi:hypothetical protein
VALCVKRRVHDIPDIKEVAGLLAVAIDFGSLVAMASRIEDRENAWLNRTRFRLGSEDADLTKGGGLKTANLGEHGRPWFS